ncbi:MAG TPA: hypothetical protein VGA60_08555 [Kiloniellales bacterium]|jgi:hypothetical protein
MGNVFRYMGQGVVYALIAVVLGFFADTPAYRHFDDDKAQLTLSLAHSGKHLQECRRRTAEELAALPANMRKPLDCTRERTPVLVEVELDGQIIVSESVSPSGLFGDGPSQIYKNFVIPSGSYTLIVRMRESPRAEGFDYQREAHVVIAPRQRFVIGFQAEAGGFIFATPDVPAVSRNGQPNQG